MNMSPLFSLLLTFFLIRMASMNAQVEASKEFKVGDDDGWRQPGENETGLYNQWAAKNRFHVGDSLRFQYTNDSVLVVEKFGYFHCNMTHPISTFHNSNTVIGLDKTGPTYFISGDPDHCKNGQRLVIEVMGPHSTPHFHPFIAAPPVSYMAVSPSPLASSGESAPVTMVSGLLALVVTFVTP
ncbi:early nodulin-like protein 7 [Actinidia eriantha]|uniref:early nodulin-like protein 7 n=1 Tax=Actinidia eriantha TaxID=165200 RepID=UPI00258FF7ED|nr:early nodulin-like protein 7 [Actinidia eriantha]